MKLRPGSKLFPDLRYARLAEAYSELGGLYARDLFQRGHYAFHQRDAAKPASTITTWKDWPEDVRGHLWWFDRRRFITFVYHTTFTCSVCRHLCQGNPYADIVWLFPTGERREMCDDCVIKVIRWCRFPKGRKSHRVPGSN